MTDAREILDRFHSVRLGVALADLKPGQVAVATSERRTFAELSYGFIRLLWVMLRGDRAAISVHPAALAEVSRMAWGLNPDDVMKDEFIAQARDALQSALRDATLNISPVDITSYHPGGAAAGVGTPALQRTVVPPGAHIRALAPADGDKWAGKRQTYMRGADHPSAQRGEAFGLFLGDKLIADIITHDPPVAEMANLIAADGIEVAEEYRGRGYGKAILSAWTCEMQARGRVCIHSTSINNAASIALARSVGYVEYAHSRMVTYNPPKD